jgi:hypothetical protein
MIATFMTYLRTVGLGVVALAQVILVSGVALAEERLSEPVYRVANETPAAQPAATAGAAAPVAAPATTPAVPVAAKVAFDLALKPGEHPLAPVLRTLKASQEQIDRNVRDYSCTLVKRERVDGELGEPQHIFMKVMHQPAFSVYMSFIKPYAGREVVYVDGQNDGKLTVLDAGFTRVLGKMNLDPTGTRAMSGQRHPITDVGMKNLTAKLSRMWQAETQFAESEVKTMTDSATTPCRINGRPVLMVQVKHPVARQNFKFHAARLFFDTELGVPIHFDAYSWPAQDGAEAPLEESYTYTNLKINNGFTARDFDANNNPEIFKK